MRKDMERIIKILEDAYDKVEQVEVDAVSTTYTASAKADLKYAISNQFFVEKMMSEEDL